MHSHKQHLFYQMIIEDVTNTLIRFIFYVSNLYKQSTKNGANFHNLLQ